MRNCGPFYCRILLFVCAAVLSVSYVQAADTIELITAEEGKLPAAPRISSRGGVTRGPTVKVVSPKADGRISDPFAFKVQFQGRGGSKIDPSSVKVTYLKKPSVDLTPRLKSVISEAGISADTVDVPPGTHDIKIEVTDAEGRTRSEIVSFTALK